MKITFQEFQIEISASELIALKEYEEKNKPKVTFDPRICEGGIVNDKLIKTPVRNGRGYLQLNYKKYAPISSDKTSKRTAGKNCKKHRGKNRNHQQNKPYKLASINFRVGPVFRL